VVRDSSDAAIPGVSVTITNLGTASTRETTTNDEGLYRVDSLPIGAYTVTASKQGFSTGSNENVQVSAGTNTDANFKLGAGGVKASVEVTDTGAILETTQSQVSKTVDQQRVMELPGRNNLNGLALLNPGVLPNQNARPGSGFVVNGNRSRSNNFTIDGANNNDQSLSIARQTLPPEAIAEFQIITNTFAAEYGRNAGSYVNVITRSGSNEFHGTGFYAWNGNGYDALTNAQERRFKANKAANPTLSSERVLRQVRDVTVDNTYGFTIGGPIKRNHTFFFSDIDFEKFRTTVSSISRPAISAQGKANLLANRAAFASPAAVDFILNTFPTANDPTFAGTSLANSTITVKNAAGADVTTVPFFTFNRTLAQGIPYGTNFSRFLEKINTKINSKDQLSFRYLFDQLNDPGSPASLPGLEVGQKSRNQSFTINDVYLISPKLINESRFTYSRRKIGFPENFTAFVQGIQLAVSGVFGAFSGGNANFPQNRIDNVFELTDNISYPTGNHALKFGYNVLRYQLKNFFAPNSRGFLQYSSLNDLLNDKPALIQKAVGDFNLNAITYEHSFFAQDDWRVNPDLTLNLGLRYEYVTTPFGYFSGAKSDINNFAPRIGFAYNPKNIKNGRVVLRAGYGIAYDQVFQNILLNVSRNYPRAITNSLSACTGCAAFNGLGSIAALNVGPNGFTGNVNLLDYRFFATNQRIRQPMSQQWTVSLQYQLANDYVVKAEYIGTKGTNLVREVEQNYGFVTASGLGNGQRLDPTRGSILVGQGIANSIYHAGQFTLEKRFSTINLFGVNFGSSQFNANYTYSSFISEADDVLGGQANRTIPADPRNPGLDRARSGYDQPHRFVMSSVFVSPDIFRNNAILNRVFSGWELSSVTTYASGTPYSVLSSTNALGILAGQISTITLSQRVGFNPNGAAGTFTTANALGVPVNSAARYILYPANSGILGSLGANSERTGNTRNTNMAVVKNIRTFGETQRLQLRAEITNLFNHRNFTLIPGGASTNTLSSTTTAGAFLNLGLATGTGGGMVANAYKDATTNGTTGRQFLFGLRYFF
jgi:outer membrane receptor protein involved in Fe transport